MSKRRHGTLRAAAAAGLNPYGWGNGRGRKRPREHKDINVLTKTTEINEDSI